MNRLLSAALLLFVLSSPFAALAQESQEAPSDIPANSDAAPPELESCFDYYRFGSVPVTVSSETLLVAQGAVFSMNATITNENAYPIDDATVFGKIFYKKNFDKSSFGPDVVDRLTLADHVNLKAGESRTFTYDWKVPAGIQPGNYQIATYVASHDRFNLSGLTFSNDVVGNLFTFAVAGEDQGAVRFDNTKTTLNGVGFHAAIFPPHSDIKADGVPLTALITNTTNLPYNGSIHWDLYSWDASNPSNLIGSSDQEVYVPAHGSTTVNYVVKDTEHTVYYIIGTLSTGEKGEPKTILTVRYINPTGDNTDTPRLAFVGATAYPAVKGQTKAFACLHSTGRSATKDVRLELSVTPLDPLGWIRSLGSLGSRTYKGEAPGAVSASSVLMGSNSDNFAVTARLYQGGKLVDEVTSTYACEDFHGTCSHIGWYIVALSGLVLALLAIAFLMHVRRRDRRYSTSVTTPTA